MSADTKVIDAIEPSPREKLINDMNPGLPPIDLSGPALSFYEFWPGDIFYLPLKIHNFIMALRYGGLGVLSAANPYITAGGFVGERKTEIFDLFPKSIAKYLPKHAAIMHTGNPEQVYEKAIKEIAAKKLAFPFVAKPDIGCRGAGVQKIQDDTGLRNYINTFPEGEVIILQAMAKHQHEVGLFYVRIPGEEKGQIISLTLKYFPYVMGDGLSTLEQLIMDDPRASQMPIYLKRHVHNLNTVPPKGEPYRLAFAGTHSKGTIFKNGNPYITPKMEEFFDALTKEMPEFYFGRFDVRFNKFEDLETGNDIEILEVNGVGAESTHIWDSKMPLWKAWGALFKQYQLAYKIGALNKKRGFSPMSSWEMWKLLRSHETLVAQYPETH